MDALANSAFTTSGALIDCVDKKMVLVLRDNTKLFGVLRSFDQYGNLVFQDSYERIYIDDCYADIPKGVYLIRGENVVLMGEIVSSPLQFRSIVINKQDLDEEDNIKQKRITQEEARQRLDKQTSEKLKVERTKSKVLHKMGFGDIEEHKEDIYLLY